MKKKYDRADRLYELYPLACLQNWLKTLTTKKIASFEVEGLQPISLDCCSQLLEKILKILRQSWDKESNYYVTFATKVTKIQELKLHWQLGTASDNVKDRIYISFQETAYLKLEPLITQFNRLLTGNLKGVSIPPFTYIAPPKLTILGELVREVFLSRTENLALKARLEAEGLTSPLVCWQRESDLVIVDGCDRYLLCLQYGMPYKDNLLIKEFADLSTAIAERISIFLARKHATDKQRFYLVGYLYFLWSKNQKTKVVCQKLQQLYGMSRSSVFNAYNYYLAYQKIEKQLTILWENQPDASFIPLFKEKLLTKQIKHTSEKIERASQLSTAEMADMVQLSLVKGEIVFPREPQFKPGMEVTIRASLNNTDLYPYNGAIAVIDRVLSGDSYRVFCGETELIAKESELVLFREDAPRLNFRSPLTLNSLRSLPRDIISIAPLKTNFRDLRRMLEESVGDLSEKQIEQLQNLLQRDRREK